MLRIISILLVLRRLFDQTNLPFFLNVFGYYWMIKLKFKLYKLQKFLWFIIHQVLVFEVLIFICKSLIIDLFVCINWNSTNLSWNLSLDVLANCLWDLSKPDIQTCFPRMFVEGRGEGAGWVFRLVHINLFLFLI